MALLPVQGHGLDAAGWGLGLLDLEPFRMRFHVSVQALYQNLDAAGNRHLGRRHFGRLRRQELDRDAGGDECLGGLRPWSRQRCRR